MSSLQDSTCSSSRLENKAREECEFLRLLNNRFPCDRMQTACPNPSPQVQNQLLTPYHNKGLPPKETHVTAKRLEPTSFHSSQSAEASPYPWQGRSELFTHRHSSPWAQKATGTPTFSSSPWLSIPQVDFMDQGSFTLSPCPEGKQGGTEPELKC